METAKRDRSINRDLVTLAAAIIVIFGMQRLSTLLAPVLLAMFFVLAFLPMLTWLQRKGVSHRWSVVIVVVTVLMSALLLVALIVVSVSQVVGNIPEYRVAIRGQIDALAGELTDVGIDVEGDDLAKQLDVDVLITIAAKVLPSVVAFLGATVLVLMLFIYVLIDSEGIRSRLRRGIGTDDAQLARLSSMVSVVGRYISIRLVMGGLSAALNVVLLLLVGVDYALFWGIVALIMSFIPYLGYWIALIPPFLIALATVSPEAAAVVFFGYWLINGGIDNILGPHLLGRGLDVTPAVSVVAIVFWGIVLGPVGAVLAMPLTVAVKLLILERYPDSRWLALVMSSSARKRAGVEPTPELELAGERTD